MEQKMTTNNTGYFVGRLLEELPNQKPLLAIYDSQYESFKVGFDFKTVELAFDRLKDEIRELNEAFGEMGENPDEAKIKNICDEAIDIVFGLINVSRHMGIERERILFLKNKIMFTQKVGTEENVNLIKKLFDEYETSFNNKDKDAMFIIAQNLFAQISYLVESYGLNLDEAIKNNVAKYLKRCNFIEENLKSRDLKWTDVALEEIYKLWKEAKTALKNEN